MGCMVMNHVVFELFATRVLLDEIVQEGTDILYVCIYDHLKIN